MIASHRRECTRQNYDYISRLCRKCHLYPAPIGLLNRELYVQLAELIRSPECQKAPAVLAGAWRAP